MLNPPRGTFLLVAEDEPRPAQAKTEGRFVPQKFEDIFEKYGRGNDTITFYDITSLLKGQRLIADPIGWGGAFFEWIATYLLLWPEDGHMKKEEIRGIYDGSLFYKRAEQRRSTPFPPE
ncbi:hypothetical protein S40288_09962, partial [Stachybotrys chartarum IBT 40288]